jgi:hypothetical protein
MLVLDFDGRVYAFGENKRGSLGTEVPIRERPCFALHEGRVEFTPIAGLLPVRVVDVCAGSHQSVALGDDGSVWHWGTYCKPQRFVHQGETHLYHFRQPARLAGPGAQPTTTFASIAATDSFLVLQPGAPRAAASDAHIDAFRRRAAAAPTSAAVSEPGRRLEVAVDASLFPCVKVSWRRRNDVPHWQAKCDRIAILPQGCAALRGSDGNMSLCLPVPLPTRMDPMSESTNRHYDAAKAAKRISDGRWSAIDDLPQLGDNEGFFEFDVAQAVNGLLPAHYVCCVIARAKEGEKCAVEHEQPAFTLLLSNPLVVTRLDVPDELTVGQPINVKVNYDGSAIRHCRGDEVVFYEVDADGTRGGEWISRDVKADGTVSSPTVSYPRRVEIVLRRKFDRDLSVVLSAQVPVRVVKPTRRAGSLTLPDGLTKFRYLRKVPISWNIRDVLSAGDDRANELSSSYIVVVPVDVADDDVHSATPGATAQLDGKEEGRGELYMTGEAGWHRAHVLCRTSVGPYLAASTPPFEIITDVPPAAIRISVRNDVGADGLVHVLFGQGLSVEWDVDPAFWNEYDGIALVPDREDQSPPAGYAQVSVAKGSALMQSMMGRFKLEYRVLAKAGQISLALPDLPRIVVAATLPAPAPAPAPAPVAAAVAPAVASTSNAAAASAPAAGSWRELFEAAGIESADAAAYDALMLAHEFPLDLARDLDRALLKDIGIDRVGHQVRILKWIASLH